MSAKQPRTRVAWLVAGWVVLTVWVAALWVVVGCNIKSSGGLVLRRAFLQGGALYFQHFEIVPEGEGLSKQLLPMHGPSKDDITGTETTAWFKLIRSRVTVLPKREVRLGWESRLTETCVPLWPAVAVLLLVLVWRSWRATSLWWRSWRATSRWKCAKCGYSLVGNTSGSCPECGTKTQAVAGNNPA